MTQPNIYAVRPSPQSAMPPRPAHMPTRMRVSLAFVEHRVNIWLRFGKPVREIEMDRRRRVAVLAQGAVCCRVKWIGNDYVTALWQLMELQAPMLFDGMLRVAGVVPSARILLRVDGAPQVKAVLEAMGAIEALGVDPCAVVVTCWRTADTRLAARRPLPDCTIERHAAHLARRGLK